MLDRKLRDIGPVAVFWSSLAAEEHGHRLACIYRLLYSLHVLNQRFNHRLRARWGSARKNLCCLGPAETRTLGCDRCPTGVYSRSIKTIKNVPPGDASGGTGRLAESSNKIAGLKAVVLWIEAPFGSSAQMVLLARLRSNNRRCLT
jgi:hypothetical protein